jgi:hypothetical protein
LINGSAPITVEPGLSVLLNSQATHGASLFFSGVPIHLLYLNIAHLAVLDVPALLVAVLNVLCEVDELGDDKLLSKRLGYQHNVVGHHAEQ